ncbi:hypothetical protein AV530_014240 [Patagioenas fasciata monilis]|uniref:Uncharacterized protein n=1 Tax=Patagioenas fasciata monilis TaxID=372326 RepID=A0A1V4JSK9_PATFA|nr:hypothetical protein AV530_014240 [Patagioenas fasciata monilis]
MAGRWFWFSICRSECLDDLEEDTAGLRKSLLHLFSLLPVSCRCEVSEESRLKPAEAKRTFIISFFDFNNKKSLQVL